MDTDSTWKRIGINILLGGALVICCLLPLLLIGRITIALSGLLLTGSLVFLVIIAALVMILTRRYGWNRMARFLEREEGGGARDE